MSVLGLMEPAPISDDDMRQGFLAIVPGLRRRLTEAESSLVTKRLDLADAERRVRLARWALEEATTRALEGSSEGRA